MTAPLRHPRPAAAPPAPALAAIQTLTGAAAVEAALADGARLRELQSLDLLAPAAEAVLDDVAQRAAAWLGLPPGSASAVLDEAHHFAALHGAEGWLAAARAQPDEWSLCRHAVSAGAALVVEDTARDPRTRDNPVVYLDGVRCYAAVPLVTAGGQTMGALCVTGAEPRAFGAGDLAMLRALAREAVARLEARRDGARRRGRRGRPAPRDA